MDELQVLPTWTQTFSELRERDWLYIDKTAQLVDMIENGGTYFLSRPRRFGKSLALSTLESLLLGEKEFFEGLAAQSWLSRKDFSPTPVIRMSLLRVTVRDGLQDMEAFLRSVVKDAANDNEISLEKDPIATDMFRNLITALRKKHNKRVAILIDEYDHAITEFIDDPEMAGVARRELQKFYSILKEQDENIFFVFMTGIASAKAGISPALDHIRDISLSSEYATLCGFTQAEIESECIEYVKKVAVAESQSTDEILEKMQRYYYGYSFDGKQLVYCPYDAFSLLRMKNFDPHWYYSGSVTYIEKYLKHKHLLPSDYIKNALLRNDIVAQNELENCSYKILFYQTGYMTLRESESPDEFVLVTPNDKVTLAMLRASAEGLLALGNDRAFAMERRLIDFLKTDAIQGIVQEFNTIIALGDYDAYASSAANPVSYECYNRDKIVAFLSEVYYLDIGWEIFDSRGRTDIVVRLTKDDTEKVYIFELKMLREDKKPAVIAQEAKNQILNRRYADRRLFTTDTITAVALVIDKAKNKIVMHDTMELKKYDVLEKPIHVSEISSDE